MNSEQFTQIIVAIISILGTLVTAYLLPWIRKNTEEKEMDRFVYFATIAVRAANQTIPPEQWEQKKISVTNYLLDVLENKFNLDLDNTDLDRIIEAIVNEVKEAKEKGN